MAQSSNPRIRGERNVQILFPISLRKGASSEQINVSVKLRRQEYPIESLTMWGRIGRPSIPVKIIGKRARRQGRGTRPPGKDNTDLERDKRMRGLMMRRLRFLFIFIFSEIIFSTSNSSLVLH